MPDHPAVLKAVGFLSFFLESLPVAKPLLVAAEPSLAPAKPLPAAEPRELDPRENFKEDCCCLLSCLKNV